MWRDGFLVRACRSAAVVPKGNWVYEFSEPSGTRFTTDDKGKFLQDLRYTPFGDATSTGVPPGTDTFTTDQWNDGDALDGFGLVKVGKRIYDPALGRFLSSRSAAHAANFGD